MEEPMRVRLPRGIELFGVIDELVAGARARVRCKDGKLRLCRVPGRYKRRIWLRVGEIILVEPWKIQGDTRGDIVFGYRRAQVEWLRKKGFLQGLG